MMNLGAVLQSIGDAGNQFSSAKLAAADLRVKQLFDQLGLKKEQIGIDEAAERLRRLKATPDNPMEETQQRLEAIIQSAKGLGIDLKPDDLRGALGLPAAAKPDKITNLDEAWLKSFQAEKGRYPSSDEIEAHQMEKKGPKEVKFNTVKGTDEPYEVVDETGKTWRINDPAMPQPLKEKVVEYREAQAKGEAKKAMLEARKQAEAINKAIKLQDLRDLNKARDEVRKTVNRGISGHSYLKSVAQEVAQAEITGGQGTTSGDMLIVEGFMQSMFGIDPKALRGSPKMMEVLLKQGGLGDQAEAMYNAYTSGGRLNQDVRKQILEAAQRQISTWDTAVSNQLILTDDPQTKNMIMRYQQQLAQENSLSDLGGKQE